LIRKGYECLLPDGDAVIRGARIRVTEAMNECTLPRQIRVKLPSARNENDGTSSQDRQLIDGTATAHRRRMSAVSTPNRAARRSSIFLRRGLVVRLDADEHMPAVRENECDVASSSEGLGVLAECRESHVPPPLNPAHLPWSVPSARATSACDKPSPSRAVRSDTRSRPLRGRTTRLARA
jgi:hypothetical protein